MKHRKILNAALFGAEVASGFDKLDVAVVAPLYDYCRERKFPPAETLARKFSEMRGEKFPFAAMADAPEGIRVFFATFRAIAEVLEPFRDVGSEGEPPEEKGWPEGPAPDQSELQKAIEEAGVDNSQELIDMARAGTSLMASIDVYTKQWPLKDWSPAEDPAEIVGDLVGMIWKTPITEIEAGRKTLQPTADRPFEPKSETEEVQQMEETLNQQPGDPGVAARTEAGQAETDTAIAASGGRFSEPVAPASQEELDADAGAAMPAKKPAKKNKK